MEEVDYTDRTCIIVVELEGQGGSILMGIVVDSVLEVLSIEGEDIEETRTFGAKLKTEDIFGIAKVEGGVKMLLDIDRVLSAEEIAVLKTAS